MEEDDKNKPNKAEKGLGTLFGAPPGVGKTAFAKAMAEQVFGDPKGYTGPITVSSDDLKDEDTLTNIFNKASKSGQVIVFDEVDRQSDSELIKAALAGDIDGVQAALDNGEDINQSDIRHGTALHIAARQGHKEICGLLIDKGIDMHKEMPLSGYTPTHAAIAVGRDDIAVYLAMRGGKIEPPSGGLFGAPAGMKPPPPSLAGSPKDDKFSDDVLDRIRAKFSEEQVKRAKSVAAMRRKRGRKGGK